MTVNGTNGPHGDAAPTATVYRAAATSGDRVWRGRWGDLEQAQRQAVRWRLERRKPLADVWVEQLTGAVAVWARLCVLEDGDPLSEPDRHR